MDKAFISRCPIKHHIFPYEPKPVPQTDELGNVIKYEYPLAIPCDMQLSKDVRLKHFPNELGLSCDRNNVTGFRALLDLINAGKELQGSGLVPAGQDDLFVMQRMHEVMAAEKEAVEK